MRRVLCCLTLVECARASYILQTPSGGVIRLEGDLNKATEQAQQLMAKQCGDGKFTIVQKGEEPIGTDPSGRAAAGVPSEPATSTRTATEVRIHYRCDVPVPLEPRPKPSATPAQLE